MYFFDAQGYKLENKTLLEDNESTIKLLKNGKKSSGKQTRYIDLQYFWISESYRKRTLMYSIVPPNVCLVISLLNHSQDPCS